jgi:molybdopterin synthase sulfur carrier subunit
MSVLNTPKGVRFLKLSESSSINPMAKNVRIPTPLRKLTNNEELVEVNGATIAEAITELQTRYPGIAERLVDEKGEVRRFVNVYVNEEDIRFLQGSQTPLKDGDEISIIPAIAGG